MKSKSTASKTRLQKTISSSSNRGGDSRMQDRDNASGNEGSTSVSSIVNTLMATAHTSQAMQNTVRGFAQAVDQMTEGDASETLTHVQETIDHATATYAHAKETYELGKIAFESIRGTSKNVFAKVKENPEPLIAAAVPLAIGLIMMLRRSQGGDMSMPRKRSESSRSLNA